MALSKWFLCGAEGCFEMDEELAFTFAEKAAKKNLPSAVFAIAYYHEVGIGGHKDLTAARQWYEKVRIFPYACGRVVKLILYMARLLRWEMRMPRPVRRNGSTLLLPETLLSLARSMKATWRASSFAGIHRLGSSPKTFKAGRGRLDMDQVGSPHRGRGSAAKTWECGEDKR
jgi:hypothetical protein